MQPLMLIGVIDGAIKDHLPTSRFFVQLALKHAPMVVYEINFLAFVVEAGMVA